MREILFRGKQIDYGKWVEGGFHVWETRQPCVVGDDKLKADEIKYMITVNSFADWNMPRSMQAREVIPETVGQYTGLKDKNSKRIFEGDIIVYSDEYRYRVFWNNDETAFWVDGINNIDLDRLGNLFESSCEVIGNIHDNPELLTV